MARLKLILGDLFSAEKSLLLLLRLTFIARL